VVTVRWNGCFSYEFCVQSGVRQGSSLSPSIFNVFIDLFLTKLRQKRIGCHIGSYFVGAILYADDLILLSASVSGLQMCLNTVCCVSMQLQLEFNCKKSCCIAFGARYNDCHTPLQLGAQLLRWNSTVKYLGIVFSAGISLNVDTDVISRKFYAA